MPATNQSIKPFYEQTNQPGAPEKDWAKKASFEWIRACRSLANQPFLKLAEQGPSNDNSFESAFSSLAHSFLRDRAAGLLPYEVGFSLIQKNDDNTRAVGVFGFKVDKQLLLGPVFWLNGELKGHEILYLHGQDLMVPMKEEWIDYLTGRSPSILGKEVSRNLSGLGALQPNLQQLTRTPYKLASANSPRLPDWCDDLMPAIAELATTNVAKMEKYAGQDGLLFNVAKSIGRPAIDFFIKMGETYPIAFKGFAQFYGEDSLKNLTKEILQNEKKASFKSVLKELDKPSVVPVKGSVLNHFNKQAEKAKKSKLPSVTVHLRNDLWMNGGADYTLSADEKQKLVEDGRLVKDDRAPAAATTVYKRSTSLKLTNPDETNVYDVLVKPGVFEQCLVIMAPCGREGTTTVCTLVSLKDKKRWLNVHPSRVFCTSRLTREAWIKWVAEQPDAGSLSFNKEHPYRGERVVLVSADGRGTFPVRAEREYVAADNDEGGKVYKVDFDDYAHYDTALTGSCHSYNHQIDREEHPDINTIRLTGRDGWKWHIGMNELNLPKGFKKIVVVPERPASDDSIPCCSSGSSEDQPLQPGSLADVEFALRNGTTPLNLKTDAFGVVLNDKKMNKESAFRSLMVEFGLNEATADELLKIASAAPLRKFEYLLKKGDPYLTEQGPDAPSMHEATPGPDPFMGSQVPTRFLEEYETRVPGMIPDQATATNQQRPIGPDAETMSVAQSATQTGQKEVFDTAVLKSLLKTVRQEGMVDKYMGDLMKGMDRLGRIYFQFLWHGEEFAERYGKQDLPEIEDGLKNAFEAMGDLILKLRRKTVEPFAEEGNDIDFEGLTDS